MPGSPRPGPPRLVTVWCADWPAIAARVPLDQPAAVFRSNRVIARTPAAAAMGVATGDRRRTAQRTCPELDIIDHDPDRDAREFDGVIRAIADMAPRLEVVEPGWLCLAARGPSRYFGGDHALADRLVDVVLDALTVTDIASADPSAGSTGATVGAAVGVGIADGRSVSAIAARRASRTAAGVMVVEAGESCAFISPLPIGWLQHMGEISPELSDLFSRLGLGTCGRLAALDPGEVLSRFGPEGLHAHRLASASDERPPAAIDPPPEWWCEQVLPEPVEQLEAVVFVAKRLADDLVARLSADGRVCTRLTIGLETEHGERHERSWYRDHGLAAAAIVERVRWQLDGWVRQPGGLSGGVGLVRLTPDEVRSDQGVQPGLWGGRGRADADAARAVVRLTGMAGEQAVVVPEWSGGRLPADRYRMVPAASVDLDDPSGRLDRRAGGPWPGATTAPSPATVTTQPTPADLLDIDEVAVAVSGRGEISAAPAILVIDAQRHRLVAWAGPWPVEQRWWAEPRRVARVQVVTESGVAYLLGVERQRWGVLATYS